jgi:hypothetical protein
VRNGTSVAQATTRAAIAASWREEGRKAAAGQMESLGYEVLLLMGQAAEQPDYANTPLPDEAEGLLQIQLHKSGQVGEYVDVSAWREGWHSYVREFWAEIKDEL